MVFLHYNLNAKQRISEKRAGDEFTHGDKGREIENECGCFPFENITSTFGDFKMGTSSNEIEMHTSERLPLDKKLAVFVFLASNSERHHPPQNKIDIFSVAITLFFLPLANSKVAHG